ncbi:MAG: hypothetical protein AAGF12_32225 [Myxococcota bacterium]
MAIPRVLTPAFMVCAIAVLGCEPTQLGNCDQPLAETLVFDAAGNPAYAGQAMVQQACAGCHGQTVTGSGRRGAPAELDFDMVGSRPPNDPAMPDEEAVARLRNARDVIFDWKEEMFDTVEDGSMPPGEIGEAAFANQDFAYADGTPLQMVASAEGREIYRNWLACGGPVVAIVADEGQTCPASMNDGFACEVRSGGEAPVAATWAAIHTEIIVARGCAVAGCHAEASDANGQLALVDAAESYTALVDMPSGGAGCDTAPNRVISGDADGSFLVQKLVGMGADGSRVCGTLGPMPPGAALDQRREIDPIRQWINDGAMNN